jgi:peptidoglycan biosynthesis protein MviN/MurJ (putative lipid II flippase)
MKTPFLLISIGAVIAVLAALNEYVFYLPFAFVAPALIVGTVSLLVGYAKIRAARPRSIDPSSRWRYYLSLCRAVVIGVTLGFLIYSEIYVDIALPVRWLVSVVCLSLAAAFFYWDVFFRHKRFR